jgi:hypothetical protein
MSSNAEMNFFPAGLLPSFRALALLALVASISLLGVETAEAAARFTSYYRGATVWRDKVPDKAFDPSSEIGFVTADDGSFGKPPGKGRLYLQGGIDTRTGQPNPLLLAAPPKATGVGVMTSVFQALLDRGQKTAQIKTLLNLSAANFVNFRAVNIDGADAKTREAVKADAKLGVLAEFLDAIGSGVCYGTCAPKPKSRRFKAAVAPGGDPVVESLAEALLAQRQTPQTTVDLSRTEQVRPVLDLAARKLGANPDAQSLDIVAQAAAALNVQVDAAAQTQLETVAKVAANASETLNQDAQAFAAHTPPSASSSRSPAAAISTCPRLTSARPAAQLQARPSSPTIASPAC